MSELQILLPYAPSKNRLYGLNKFGVLYKRRAWSEWRCEVERFLAHQNVDLTPFDGDVKVSALVGKEDCRLHDCVNMTDALCDMLQEIGVVENDRQIADFRIRWDREGRVANGLMVTIEGA